MQADSGADGARLVAHAWQTSAPPGAGWLTCTTYMRTDHRQLERLVLNCNQECEHADQHVSLFWPWHKSLPPHTNVFAPIKWARGCARAVLYDSARPAVWPTDESLFTL